MAYPTKLLAADEKLIRDLHPHWKALISPTVTLVLVLGVGGFIAAAGAVVARRRVRDGAPSVEPGPGEQRRVVDAFLAASRAGDFELGGTCVAPFTPFTPVGGATWSTSWA